MKKELLTLAFVLFGCMSAFPQATSLTIDCQNPGWLSSKIGYGDQQSVVDLTVTGYLNNTDMEFLGTLMKLHSLKRLDLEQVNIVSSDADKQNVLTPNVFNIDGSYVYMEKILLPLSVTKYLQSNNVDQPGSFSNRIYVDTLVLGGPAMPTIENSVYGKRSPGGNYTNTHVKCIIIREGVESIAEQCFCYKDNNIEGILESVMFPSSLKSIGDEAFRGCGILGKTNLCDGITSIGTYAFFDTMITPDTLYLPNSLEEYNMNSFPLKTDQTIIIGSNVTSVINRQDALIGGRLGYTNYITNYFCSAIIIDAVQPPHLSDGSYDINNGYHGEGTSMKGIKIYVPEGSKGLYQADNNWKSGTIIENIKVNNIVISEIGDNIYVGESKQLQVNVEPRNAINKEIIWNSSEPSIASVSSDGTVTGISPGEVIIEAINKYGNISASITLTIYEHTTGVSLSESSITMNVGDTQMLQAFTLPLETSDGQIEWTTNDDKIATVDNNGNIIGTGIGTCTITATSVDGGHTATCEVTVIQPVAVTGITLSHSTLQFDYIGETYRLEATIIPSDAANQNIKWMSSNESVCIVSNGMIVTIGMGTSVIIATTEDGGYIATCVVTVTSATGISSAKENDEKIYQIYDVNGTKQAYLKKGINIIQFTDGSSRKVLLK